MTPQEAVAIENQIGVLLNQAEADLASSQAKRYAAKALISDGFLALYDDKAVSEGLKSIDKAIKAGVVDKDRLAEAHKDADAAMMTASFPRPRGGGK